MDFDEYVAARYGRLIEHAVLLGCAEGEAGTYVDQVPASPSAQPSRTACSISLPYRAATYSSKSIRPPWRAYDGGSRIGQHEVDRDQDRPSVQEQLDAEVVRAARRAAHRSDDDVVLGEESGVGLRRSLHEADAVGGGPVSYTHLTLPTNREV